MTDDDASVTDNVTGDECSGVPQGGTFNLATTQVRGAGFSVILQCYSV